MIKRTLLVGGSLVALSLFLFGREAASYLCTGASRAKEAVRNTIPLEFEIDRARKMVHDLVPDIRHNMHLIAKEEVGIEQLESQISASETQLSKQREQILTLRADLANGQGAYQYAGRRYTSEQVQADLANRFERYKTNEMALASLRELHAARQKSWEAARQKLDGMLAAKRQLEVDVENLEARLKMVEVAQTGSQFQFDDSRLGQVKELISDLRSRLSVAEKLVSADSQLQGEISLNSGISHENICHEVADYFHLSELEGSLARKED